MFTDDELLASVNKFLVQGLSVQRRLSGARDVEELKQQVMDLVSVSLLLKPDAYFYLITLTRNRTLAVLRRQIARLQYIASVGAGLGRPEKKVTSTVELANAEAAILTLNAGLNERSQGVSGSIGPSVERFRRSVEAFARTELVKNVVVAGDVVPTASELREKIATLWVGAAADHSTITEMSEAMESAISRFGEAQLPARTLRTLVGRVQTRLTELQEEMAAVDAPSKSRDALVDLVAMRGIVTKAASFRPPQLVRAPGTGAAMITLLDSPGVRAEAVGQVSAPFFATGSGTFEVDVDGFSYTPTVLRDSRALLVSAELTLPGAAGNIDIAVLVNGAVTETATVDLSLHTGVTLAAALDSAMGLDVTWNAGDSIVEFRIPAAGVLSPGTLEVLVDTTAQAAALGEFWRGSLLIATPDLITAEEVIAEIGAAASLLNIRSERTIYYRGDALYDAGILYAMKFYSGVASYLSDYTLQLDVNAEANGAQPGDELILSSGLTATRYRILEVDGRTLTVDSVIASFGVTLAIVGASLEDVPAGASVRVVSGRNRGDYVVSGVASLIGLELEDGMPFEETCEVVITTEYLRVATQTDATSSSLELGAGAANTALGLENVSAVNAVSSGQVAVDLVAAGVIPGDELSLISPADATSTHTVTGVTTNRVSFSPPVVFESGVWQFSIRNANYVTYLALQAGIGDAWGASQRASFPTVDASLNRIFRGAQYTTTVKDPLADYLDALLQLEAALVGYTIPVERGVRAALAMLEEQGMARAKDILVALRIKDFFELSSDGVSYDTHLMRASGEAARVLTPVHKYAKSQFVAQTHRTTGHTVDAYDPEDEVAP